MKKSLFSGALALLFIISIAVVLMVVGHQALPAAGGLVAAGGHIHMPYILGACFGAYAEKAMLDWLFLGATPTRPGTVGVGLSLGAPTSLSMSEIGTGSGYSVQNAGSMGAAASPAGSVSNTVAMTYGPFSSAQSITGLIMKDTIATAGNMIAYGNLATARTVAIGDSLVIAVGALTVSLA